MFSVFNQHRHVNTHLGLVPEMADARSIADSYAAQGVRAFVRVFQDGVFVTAFSVIGGAVRPHNDVTFPTAHF